MLHSPNAHGCPNSDVIVPWINGLDVTRRWRDMWIIDFGVARTEEEAARYDRPLAYVAERVLPERKKNKRDSYRQRWWIHVEARPAMRAALAKCERYLCTTTVSKHRLFLWYQQPILPDHQLIALAKSDDAFFGVVHSRPHEIWALRLGTRLETRPRYTPTTSFETFPFPDVTDQHAAAIAAAAAELDRLRNNWLNPPEWTREEVLTFPGSVDGPWAHYVESPNDRGIGTVRYRRLVPVDAECAQELAKRTLTRLYNERPAWLANSHRRLDEAVLAAYGWSVDLTDDEILARLLELNLAREPAG